MISLCAQGFLGDFGEMGPPGPDGIPVSELMCNIIIIIITVYYYRGTVHVTPKH